jgi:hypothetical protein
MKRLNPDMISHSLSLCGVSAYRATILEMAEQINELQEAVEELQGLVSGEMMAGLVKPGELREVVAELGSGWRIERMPISPNVSAATSIPPAANPAVTTTVADVDRQMAGVGRMIVVFQRALRHSPGYPADDGEMAGADELTDVGLSYRELDRQLALTESGDGFSVAAVGGE